MTRDEFITELLDGLGLPPAYFPQNVMLNIKGYESLDSIIEKSTKPLTANDFEALANSSGAVILDVRHENDFVKSHIPKSIFIGLQGNFAPWVGALLMDVKQPLLLITAEGKEEEAITRLSRVGFDNVLGYLDGGIESWKIAGFETDTVQSISPQQFAGEHKSDSIVVDSRKPGEYQSEHIDKAINIPLDTINSHLQEIPKNDFYLHCAGGYRSVIMASILKSRGIHNMINVEKGMNGIKTTTVPLIQTSCQST